MVVAIVVAVIVVVVVVVILSRRRADPVDSFRRQIDALSPEARRPTISQGTSDAEPAGGDATNGAAGGPDGADGDGEAGDPDGP